MTPLKGGNKTMTLLKSCLHCSIYLLRTYYHENSFAARESVYSETNLKRKLRKILSALGAQQAFFGTRDLPLFETGYGESGFDIAGNGMSCAQGTGNVLIFPLGKRERYETIA